MRAKKAMNSSTPFTDVGNRALGEAAAWRAHLMEAGTETSEAFEAWFAAAPENRAAWERIQEPWALFGEHAAAPELVELRRAALADARGTHRRRFRHFRFGSKPGFAAAAAALIVLAAGAVFWQRTQPDVYRTAQGERRVVTLSDGSQIALDSLSEVRVRYTAAARDLALFKGQARFDVAHDVERPFSVIAGTEKVVATGTAFNVDLLGSNVLVTLLEGHVVVLDQTKAAIPETLNSMVPSPAGGRTSQTGRGVELNAGEQLVTSSTAVPSIEKINVDRATAWQNGQLIFENEPLSSVIARVNRYTDRQIKLTDAKVAEVRISGVFHTGDVDGFVRTITDYLPVRSERGENGSIRLSHR
jgi:transmembrane sensor